MIIFPAIDLLEGQVVRLEQGRREARTVYGADPVAFARQWREEGAEALHVVDLDGAFSGVPRHLDVVAAIARELSIPVQLGGGMREEETVARALESGVARVILGTRACEDLDFVRRLVARFGGEKIAVGIDAKDGFVAVKGWTEKSTRRALDLARELEGAGAGLIIYTDIATDGMFTGPNYRALGEMLEAVSIPVIASGGIGAAEHIAALRAMPKPPYGAIVGKALYDGKVTLAQILK
ncbi:MAG: 1-(5-phosphoribosyl)-5-[(5-phosphoribosylamino)methylideneamino]imidazole-4-carboxamide isomerase [Verrucomicrobium sp.]|nr:1-(5-phosphoribosyl)-5-[(5-phosphoribosylamino)methylideneamino]imidazole-4-carboxamide isomerase [Verrucomicrobium sp.]